MAARYVDYIETMTDALRAVEATIAGGTGIAMDDAIAQIHRILSGVMTGPNKVMFIGNGGSAGIAGHMAIDFAKNGGVRSITFNDASSLTCLGNDLGYEHVFAKQVDMQGLTGDVLIAISSSGESKNILRAAEMAAAKGCMVITLSGFSPGNALRQLGTVNFYVKSGVYGFVETAHQAVLHAILDTGMGWSKATANVQPSRPLV
ncbi:MAG: SIS domain-containing protein [Rhodospirillaceae bacterium]|nr:MAG: SIS domain-containing protein [Rhodospirillaceae bacterium]